MIILVLDRRGHVPNGTDEFDKYQVVTSFVNLYGSYKSHIALIAVEVGSVALYHVRDLVCSCIVIRSP